MHCACYLYSSESYGTAVFKLKQIDGYNTYQTYLENKYLRQNVEVLQCTGYPCLLQAKAVLCNVGQCASSRVDTATSYSQLSYILVKLNLFDSLHDLNGLESDTRY